MLGFIRERKRENRIRCLVSLGVNQFHREADFFKMSVFQSFKFTGLRRGL
jgi:hypothetical protein